MASSLDHLFVVAYALAGTMLAAKAGALAALYRHRHEASSHFPSVKLVPLTVLGRAQHGQLGVFVRTQLPPTGFSGCI